MKHFKITVRNKLTKKIIYEFGELSNTKSYLEKKYRAKYWNELVKVEPAIKKLPTQLTID